MSESETEKKEESEKSELEGEGLDDSNSIQLEGASGGLFDKGKEQEERLEVMSQRYLEVLERFDTLASIVSNNHEGLEKVSEKVEKLTELRLREIGSEKTAAWEPNPDKSSRGAVVVHQTTVRPCPAITRPSPGVESGNETHFPIEAGTAVTDRVINERHSSLEPEVRFSLSEDLANYSFPQQLALSRVVQTETPKRQEAGTRVGGHLASAINLIQTFNCTSYAYGVTVMMDKIYVLCHKTNLIKVFENRNQFQFLKEIPLFATKLPCDLVYSNETKCFYIGDTDEDCIWKLTATRDRHLTKWLIDATYPRIVSLSTDGQLLKLKSGEPISQLITYNWNANIVRSLKLPEDIKLPRHAVQTLTGNFILIHRLNDASNGIWVISQLNNVGQLIHRFIPRNQLEQLYHPVHLSLDSENNRLFVADAYNHRVIVLDSNSLIWIQVLLSNETNGITYPHSLFYEANQRRLMVAHLSVDGQHGKVTIYELERNSLPHYL